MISPVSVSLLFLLAFLFLTIELLRIKKECGYFNIEKINRVYTTAKICSDNEIPENAVLGKNTIIVAVKDGNNIKVLAIKVPKLFLHNFIKVRVLRDYVDVIYEKNNINNIRFYDLTTIASIIAIRMIKWAALLIFLLFLFFCA